MVSFIVDEHGKKTHAVVPIDEWYWYSSLAEIEKGKRRETIAVPVIDGYDYPMKQLEKMIPLVEAMDYESVDEWNELYNDFFRYMKGLKNNDIEMLYCIRNDDFRYAISQYKITDKRDMFSFRHQITSKNSGNLTLNEAKDLHIAIYELDDKEFLNFFNKNFRTTVKDKKIRIEAEINRLFIYDLMKMYPKKMEYNYDISKKEAQSKLMKYLYNDGKGAKTQVQRALKEADLRVFRSSL